MNKRFLLAFSLLCFFVTFSFAQTSLQGKVTDEETSEVLSFGSVALYKEGVLITGATTDLDGNYNFNSIDPGTYDVEASYTGYTASRVNGVIVYSGRANVLNFTMGSGVIMDEIVVTDYKVPVMEVDKTTQGSVITGKDIQNLPTRSLNGIVSTTAGVSTSDEGDAQSFRGGRENSNVIIVDGIRVIGGVLPPTTEIEQLEVITGGLGAEHGDATGGVTSITTKGPSSKFTGGIELESSQYLDPYGFNLVNGNVSGPILKKKNGESIIGFRLSGQFLSRLDDDPPAVPVFRATEEALAEIEANPITPFRGTNIPSAEFLKSGDVEELQYKPNEESVTVDVNAKIDAKITKNIDLTFSGGFRYSKDRFTPASSWRLLNTQNNPYSTRNRYRGNVRFRHRLGRSADGESQQNESIIRNATYSLQFGYEKSSRDISDHRSWTS